MLDEKIIKQIKSTSVDERIKLMELILDSLKGEMNVSDIKKQTKTKPFKIRQFSLGKDVNVDRDELYAERNI